MKKIASLVAFFALTLSACAGIFGVSPKLQEYKSESGGFSVMVPIALEETNKAVDLPNVGNITMYMFSGQQGNTGYTVGYADFPEDLINQSDPDKVLDGSANGAVGNINGVLVGKLNISLDGYPGREIIADAKLESGQDATLKARIYLVHNRLYEIIIFALKGQVSNDDMTKFLDSFTLIHEKSTTVLATPGQTDTPIEVKLPPAWTKPVTNTPLAHTPTQTSIANLNAAPDFSAQALDGSTFHLKEHAGHIIVLLFVNSSDSRCIKVIPLMQPAHQQFSPILFVLIFEGDSQDSAKKFITQYGLSFPAVLDSSGMIGAMYAVHDLPELTVIYTDQIIHDRYVGIFTQDKLNSILKKTD